MGGFVQRHPRTIPNEISDIPIANKAYRLRVLQRMATAENMKNMGMTAQLLEQAAKECGDAYTNKHKVEHSGGLP
jgi:hypothetical protein